MKNFPRRNCCSVACALYRPLLFVQESSPKTNPNIPLRRDKQNKSAQIQHFDSSKSWCSTRECRFKPFDICFNNQRRLRDNTPLNVGGMESLNEITPTKEDATQQILRSGMVLFKNYLTNQEQVLVLNFLSFTVTSFLLTLS